MIVLLLNKVFFILFVLSVLICVRHGFYFVQTLLLSSEEEPLKYRLNNKALLILGIALSFVITCIITGIKF